MTATDQPQPADAPDAATAPAEDVEPLPDPPPGRRDQAVVDPAGEAQPAGAGVVEPGQAVAAAALQPAPEPAHGGGRAERVGEALAVPDVHVAVGGVRPLEPVQGHELAVGVGRLGQGEGDLGFGLDDPSKVKRRQDLLGSIERLKDALVRCETEFAAMSRADQAERVRGYGNDRATRVQTAIRGYELVLRDFLGLMGIRVQPLGVGSRPTS